MMFRESRWRLGLMLLCFYTVDGLIEIVEEQQCQDFGFRLTCRELDSHIAILEAYYTAMEDYGWPNTTRERLVIRTENDSELDQVHVYISPQHNGVYEQTNITRPHRLANATLEFNDTSLWNDSLLLFNDTVDVFGEFVNDSDHCDAVSFRRSYASWREGDKLRRASFRNASVNLRSPFSYRCTGVNHCNFLLSEDYPPSSSWSPGVVYIKYACFDGRRAYGLPAGEWLPSPMDFSNARGRAKPLPIVKYPPQVSFEEGHVIALGKHCGGELIPKPDDTISLHYCNRELRIAEWGAESEGYIRTPGYPHFYVGDECRWRLIANPEQRIRVTFLDVSLRSIGPFENECKDFVAVQDSNGDNLLYSCEQVDMPIKLTSTTNTVEVAVEARSKGAYPKRGVLLHYKSIGCVTLSAPSSGYLVYRNEDVAHYMCNVNFVFVDTRQRARLLWCYDDNRWNDTVPLCIAETVVKAVGNDSSREGIGKETKLPPHQEPNMIVDIVIPSLLIAALFIGNAFIVLIIYKYRKRKNDDLEDEFNTIPLNGNVHSAGYAV